MATVFDLQSVAVSGAIADVAVLRVGGAGDLSMFVGNNGANALNAMTLEGSPASGGPWAMYDNATFATLAAGAAARVNIDPGGLEWLRIRAGSLAATELRIHGSNDYESSA